jgi:hypothetical protein
MTVYCYDTEFLEDGHTIELISIGIVCEDGREYYAVNGDMDQRRIKEQPWLMEHVWPYLPRRLYANGEYIDRDYPTVKSRAVIAQEVWQFLLADGPPELWAYYSAYDHVALAWLWGPMMNLPAGIPMWTHDLMQPLEQMPDDFEPPTQENEHNALDDARWNMALLRAMDTEFYSEYEFGGGLQPRKILTAYLPGDGP